MIINKIRSCIFFAIGSSLAPTSMAQIPTNSDTQIPSETTLLPTIAITANSRKTEITATKTSTPLAETPQSISVITSKQITQRGAATVSQALGYTSGVFAEQRLDGQMDGLFIRGFGGNPGYANFNSYVDGLRTPQAQYLGNPTIDPYLLNQVDVLKGPSSVLYGSANPGGIVNMQTKLPTGEEFGEVGFRVGNRNQAEAFFDLGGNANEDGTLQYRLVGIGRTADTQVDVGIHQRRFAISPSLVWNPNDNTKLTTYINYQNDPDNYYASWYPAEGTIFPNTNGRIPRNFYIGDNSFEEMGKEQLSIGYKLEHKFSNNLNFRQNARFYKQNQSYKGITVDYWTPLTSDGSINREATETSEHIHQFVIDNQLEGNFSLGKTNHILLIGADAEASKSDMAWDLARINPISVTNPQRDFNPVEAQFIPWDKKTARKRQLGIYVQDQIAWDQFSIMLGARGDRVELDTDDHLNSSEEKKTDTAFTYKSAFSYQFENGMMPYISYSTSFEPMIGTDANSKLFKPSEGKQIETGMKYQPTGSSAIITAALFQIDRTNIKTSDSNRRYLQTGEARSRGIELEGSSKLTDSMSINVSYTFIDAKVKKDLDPTVQGNVPISIPQHMASAWANYYFNNSLLTGLNIGAGVRYTGSSWGNPQNDFKVSAASVIDLSMNYDFSHKYLNVQGLEGSLIVRNLFDKDYMTSCFQAGACFYAQARTITAGLNYRW